jgi:hypothetical protein
MIQPAFVHEDLQEWSEVWFTDKTDMKDLAQNVQTAEVGAALQARQRQLLSCTLFTTEYIREDEDYVGQIVVGQAYALMECARAPILPEQIRSDLGPSIRALLASDSSYLLLAVPEEMTEGRHTVLLIPLDATDDAYWFNLESEPMIPMDPAGNDEIQELTILGRDFADHALCPARHVPDQPERWRQLGQTDWREMGQPSPVSKKAGSYSAVHRPGRKHGVCRSERGKE